MSLFQSRDIWIPVEVNSREEQVTLQGDVPQFAKGAECRIFVSLFKSRGAGTTSEPGEVFDSSNIASLIFKIWADGYGSGTLLLDSSDAAAITAGVRITADPTATAAEFLAKTKAQFVIYLPASVTANVTASTRYGVFTGATSEAAAQPDYFGRCQVESLEVGLSTVATPPTPAELYVRADVFNAGLAQCVKWGRNEAGRTFVLVSPDGHSGRQHGTDDNGNPISNLEEYP